MATPGKHSPREAGSFQHLSNEELGALWADTVRAHALRRTGRTHGHWRKMLDEPDVLGLHAEFRRRAMEREEEYEAWIQLTHSPGL